MRDPHAGPNWDKVTHCSPDHSGLPVSSRDPERQPGGTFASFTGKARQSGSLLNAYRNRNYIRRHSDGTALAGVQLKQLWALRIRSNWIRSPWMCTPSIELWGCWAGPDSRALVSQSDRTGWEHVNPGSIIINCVKTLQLSAKKTTFISQRTEWYLIHQDF